ncbi:MAG TPA: lytic murein transglycosylase [Alphaproteobacteria bacterium]
MSFIRLILLCLMTVTLTACAATTPTKTASAQVDPAGFENWRSDFTQRAIQAGYDPTAVRTVTQSVTFQPQLIELDRKQPETQLTLQQYVEKTVSTDRIAKGRQKLAENRTALNAVAARTGVPAKVIVALWGKETSYGAFTGGVKIGDALSTMAYEGRRRDMFERELLAFIQITQVLGKDPNVLKGSWAGAMGQCQFMPTSYLKYAADGSGDGKADIWFSLPDVFASAANFLQQSGWQAGQLIAQPIRLPANINVAALGRDKAPRPLRDWQQAGVTIIGNAPTNPNIPSKLYAPDGVGGPAFILYPNFDVLLRWNNSGYFGVGVTLLSDQLDS